MTNTITVNPKNLVGRTALVPITEMAQFQTLGQILSGTEVEATDYYTMFLERGCSPEEAAKNVRTFLERRDSAVSGRPLDIGAQIGPRGEIIIDRGYESAAIAAHLGIDTLSIEITARDPQWQNLIDRLRRVRNSDFSYMPIFPEREHPEFQGWNFARGRQRAEMIAADTGDLTGQRWLDAGSLNGYHTRMLNLAGAEAHGVEMHKPYAEIAGILNKVIGTDCRYHNEELTAWLKDNNAEKFDGIVCLSIIHNIAQAGFPEATKQAFAQLSKMAPIMYFDIGQANEGGQVTGSGLDLREENLERFIRTNTQYRTVTSLGEDTQYYNRKLFKLER
ncbi:hypothetical protein COY27_04140 [Candidatus Woesearchaeota archaeon CG_4_10_14_0_2_um_filter_33_13]|nr:MAG: hypothetical protein COY27_04140 [Candidatus Woesearchaeota archaeon CG_4_10_14_0_2_um_filter_33_13]